MKKHAIGNGEGEARRGGAAGSEAVAHRALARRTPALHSTKRKRGKGREHNQIASRREEGGRREPMARTGEMRRAIIDGSRRPRHEGRETNKYRVVVPPDTRGAGRWMALL